MLNKSSRLNFRRQRFATPMRDKKNLNYERSDLRETTIPDEERGMQIENNGNGLTKSSNLGPNYARRGQVGESKNYVNYQPSDAKLDEEIPKLVSGASGSSKLKNISAKMELIYDRISIGIPKERQFYNKNFEDVQWDFDMTEKVVDHKGNFESFKRDFTIPDVILKEVEKFKQRKCTYNYFKDFFQIGNAVYFILSNRIFVWFFEERDSILVHDFEEVVKNLCLIDAPSFLRQRGKNKYLLIIAMENKIDFRLVDENLKLRNLNCEIKIKQNPEFFYYERITKRVFVGFLNSEMVQELVLSEVKPSFYETLNCGKRELIARFVNPAKFDFYKKIKKEIKEIVLGKSHHFISHKMAVDLQKQMLYHLESSWRSENDKSTGLLTEVLVDQFLACYDISNGKFILKGKKNMSDIKKSIMFYHGQETDEQLKRFKRSPIVGISVPMNKDWDLNIAFETSQQIQVKIIGSKRSFEILFNGIIYGSNYTQKLEKLGCGIPPRISSCGTLQNGEIDYVHFDVNKTNYFIIENEMNLSSSILGGNSGVDGKLYPTEKAETETMSLLFQEKFYRDERVCFTEILEDSPVLLILDYARLGRYRRDYRSLNQLYMHFGHRKRLAVMHGEKIRIFSRLNYNDILFVILVSVNIAKDANNEDLVKKLMKDLSYYALKMGFNMFCSTLLFLIMAEKMEEFFISKAITEKYEAYIKTFGVYPNFSDVLGSTDCLARVKQQALELLHFLGDMNEMTFRDKIFKEMKNEAQFSRVVDFSQFSTLTSDFSSRSFALIFAFCNIVNANWGRLFFNYDRKKKRFGKAKLQNRVSEEEVIVTIKYLERLRKAILYWKSLEGTLEKIDDPVYKYFFENELKMRERTNKMNDKLTQREKHPYLDGVAKLFEKSGGEKINKFQKIEKKQEKTLYKIDNPGEQQNFNSINTGIMNKKDDTGTLESISLTIQRSIEIMRLCLQLNKSEVLKDSLQPEIKTLLSKLKFEEIIFSKTHEFQIKRIFFKMLEIDESEIKVIRESFRTLITPTELKIFKILRYLKQTSSKYSGKIASMGKSVLSTSLISMEECIKELRSDIPSLRLIYLVDTFKSFIKLDMVDEYISLLVKRIEYLQQEKPKIEKKIQTFKKLVKNNTKPKQARNGFHRFGGAGTSYSEPTYEDSFAKSNVLEMEEKLDNNLIEQNGIMRNIFGIVIELSGLEKKESEFFSLPKFLKQIRTVDRIWNKMIPNTKPTLIKHNWSRLTGRESKLTFFQKSLIGKNQKEVKGILLKTMKKVLNSTNQNLRIKMLTWLFGEGKLSLIDTIDSRADNVKITNDLCEIAQKEGIINSKNGTESCLYLIKSFQKREKFDIVIDLIFKMADNKFFGEDVNFLIENSEGFLKENFDRLLEENFVKECGDWIVKLRDAKLPSLRTKIVHLRRGIESIKQGKIQRTSVENRNKILFMLMNYVENYEFQVVVIKKLEARVNMLKKVMEFLDKVTKEKDFLEINKILSPSQGRIRSSHEIRRDYKLRMNLIAIRLARLELSVKLLSSKMYQKTEVITFFIKKFRMWDVYLLNISEAFKTQSHDEILVKEFESGVSLMIEESAKVGSIIHLTNLGNMEGQEVDYERILSHPVTSQFMLECYKEDFIFPKNLQKSFHELKVKLIEDNQMQSLLQFDRSIGVILRKIEMHNSQNELINYMLDELEDYINIDNLGREDKELFKTSKKAVKLLEVTNIGRLDCVWLSLFFRDMLDSDIKKYCKVIEEVQSALVEFSEVRGDERVEIAFRFAVTFSRMVKDLSVKLQSIIGNGNLTEDKKYAFTFFSSKFAEFRRILLALARSEILDEMSLTNGRCLYIKYLADSCFSYVNALNKDYRFGNVIYRCSN